MGYKSKNEADILLGISRGDSNSQKMLYDKYVEYLSAVCARYILDKDDRKDILQESFIKIFSSIDKFEHRGEGSLKAWMTRIVVNESLQFLKKTSFNDLYEDDFSNIDVEDEPQVELVSDDVINEMILSLPPGYRMVFNLYVFENLSHKEIAQMLNIKVSSSASQFSRAKASLAKKIKEYIKAHIND